MKKKSWIFNLSLIAIIGAVTLFVSNCKKLDPPVVISKTTVSDTMGTEFSYQILATNDPTSYNATGLPSGVSVNTNTGLINGMLTTAGTFTVELSATNSIGTGIKNLNLIVIGLAPEITSASTASGTVGTAFSYQIIARNNPTSYSVEDLPSSFSLDTGTGLISGTPTAAGTFTVGLRAANSIGTGTMNLKLTIAGLPPAITSAANASASVGIAFSYLILAKNNPTSFNATELPSGLSVNTGTGLISGTLASSGNYNISLSAINSYGTGTLNLELTVVSQPSPDVPLPAASVGYNRLTFNDDFNSLSTIDVNTTKQAGYNWYTDLPFGGSRTLPSDYSISDGVITMTSTGWTANWALSSYSSQGNVGNAFHYGYFEARIKFDPTLGLQSRGFPAWWSFSVKHSVQNYPTIWAELDFFEAYTGGYASYSGAFIGTVHDWRSNSAVHYQNSNNWISGTGIDDQWHTYGCLWIPGRVTWYLDGVALMTQYYSSIGLPYPQANGSGLSNQVGVFNILDTDPMGMLLILGSSPGWPMDVDYVQVWQQ